MKERPSNGAIAVSDPRQLHLPIPRQAANAMAERAAKIVAGLGEGQASAEEVFAAFEELDALPPDVVRGALVPLTGPAPDPERLDAATRSAHGFPPRRLHLIRTSVAKDADVLDLGPVVEEQLRIAGKTWDGLDLEPEERLDGESESTSSFAGTLEHHVLSNADEPGSAPLFDLMLYAEDSGAIFRAGTTELVGAIAYGTVEMSDRRARMAIQEVLSRPIDSSSSLADVADAADSDEEVDSAAPTKKVAPAKKRAAAKAKSAPAKKVAATKKAAAATKAVAPAKKAAAPAKKAAAAKKAVAPAKKPAAKTVPAAKKASAKKATTSAKKATTAKKPAAKKSRATDD